MKILRLLPLFILLIFSNNYSQSKDADYFPLSRDMEWSYIHPMPNDPEGKGWTTSKRVTEYDREYNSYIVKEIQRVGDAAPFANYTLIEKRNGKALLLASKGGIFNTDWRFHTELILDYPLEVGKKWDEEVEGGKIEYKVLQLIDNLTVKAGLFNNVFKVRKVTIIEHNSSNSKPKNKTKKKATSKSDDVPTVLTLDQYYAPNVGLIREESVKPDGSVSLFTELIEYNKYF